MHLGSFILADGSGSMSSKAKKRRVDVFVYDWTKSLKYFQEYLRVAEAYSQGEIDTVMIGLEKFRRDNESREIQRTGTFPSGHPAMNEVCPHCEELYFGKKHHPKCPLAKARI